MRLHNIMSKNQFFFIFIKFKNMIFKRRLTIITMFSCCIYVFILSRDLFSSSQSTKNESSSCSENKRKFSIFCLILTTAENLPTKANAVYRTWARECDSYKFIVKIEELNFENTENMNGRIETRHGGIQLLQPAGWNRESYANLTDKVYSAIADVYQRYPNFDWYLKADDDTFVFMQNLKEFLSDKNPCDKVTYGYNIKFWFNLVSWQAGGAGYVFSQRSLLDLGAKLAQNWKYCPNTGVEDQDVSLCFKMLGTKPGKSRDSLGRERFHP